MAWEHLSIDKPHLVYIILGGFTSLFMLCSSIIKERLYIGEATVATFCGVIFGPHAANLIDPGTWGNTDLITLEFSRLVLVVQCFAVGVELPKAYMERHWRSVVFLLVPVMTFGWLITSLFIWAFFLGQLNWLDSLVVSACVTATDPVLASSVVGKGKFAKERVPKHLRDLLSAESGCNDGMAFPFIYLGLYLVRYRPDAGQVAFHWICFTILYECIFGAVFGFLVGYIARRAIRYAHTHQFIDRESFLVFYFVLALFCAGSGSMLGMDDLLIGFACGVGFSNDGSYGQETEESSVSNVIDLLINLAFFVYFGTIIPWNQFNSASLGTSPWRLVVIAILVVLFRRIPIMLALKPIIPDIKNWREALFAGHFGPIGVGALYVAILARAELETDGPIPLSVLPPTDAPYSNIIRLVWPITTFLVMASIVIHGSSVAVFTLGRHVGSLTLTYSFTTRDTEGAPGNWMDRLPRIQSRSRSQASSLRQPSSEENDMEEKGFAQGLPKLFLRRQRESDMANKATSKARRRLWDAGPIEPTAIGPVRSDSRLEDPSFRFSGVERIDSDTVVGTSGPNSPVDDRKQIDDEKPGGEPREEIYEEGKYTVIEDEEGNVLKQLKSDEGETEEQKIERARSEARKLRSDNDLRHSEAQQPDSDPGERRDETSPADDSQERPAPPIARDGSRMSVSAMRQRLSNFSSRNRRPSEEVSRKMSRSEGEKQSATPARAFRYGRTVIIEDEDGEVIKRYDLPAPTQGRSEKTRQRVQRMGSLFATNKAPSEGGNTTAASSSRDRRMSEVDPSEEGIRFKIAGNSRRMSQAEFLDHITKMDPRSRVQVVEESDVPEPVKRSARADAWEHMYNDKEEAEFGTPPLLQSQTSNSSKGRNGKEPETFEPSEAKEPTIPQPVFSSNFRGLDTAAARRRRAADAQIAPDDTTDDYVPTHSFTRDLERLSRGTETAAQRRRRAAEQDAHNPSSRLARALENVKAQQDEESDLEDDDTERVPPNTRLTRQRSGSQPQRSNLEYQEETAAERRRREGALGVSKEDSSSDEDETHPRVPRRAQPPTPPTPGRMNIRFADQVSPRKKR